MSRSWPEATQFFDLSAATISGHSSWVGRCLRRPLLESHHRLNRKPASDDHDAQRREAMTRWRVAGVVLVFVAGIGQQVLGSVWSAKPSDQTGTVPKFEVDPAWPQKLPNNWVL